MRKSAAFLLILLSLLSCIPCVQADQIVPFAPPGNVTGNYTFQQGNDIIQMNTNFPINSQDIVFPEWLFVLFLIFIFVTICLGLIFFLKGPEAWVNVMACGVIILGLSLTAGMMAPLVGSTQVFHQVVPVANSTTTIYVNEIIVYSLGSWIGWGCYGLAVAGFAVFIVSGYLLQMKQARIIANKVQAEKIQAEEIDFRKRDRK
jgi:hypothetical protein